MPLVSTLISNYLGKQYVDEQSFRFWATEQIIVLCWISIIHASHIFLPHSRQLVTISPQFST
jgi:hypothetical protein